MKDSIRLRLVGVGFAAAGLAVGTAIGAVAGATLSPDDVVTATTTTAPPPSTSTVPTTEIEPGDPLDLTPLVTSIGVAPGAILSIETSPETGDTSLYRLGEQGMVSVIDLGFEGPIIGYGRAAAALGALAGTLVVPFDGGEATLLETATNASVLDTTLAWLEPSPPGEWTLWTLDLDTADAEPSVAFTFAVPEQANQATPWVLHVDDQGGVVITDRLWVVPSGGEPWSLEGPWPQAVLPEVLIVATPPETGDGTWPLVTYDRRTGEPGGPVTSPLGDECWPVDAEAETIAWACEGDLPFVTTADGSIHRVAADWVELIDDGRTALWFGAGNGVGTFAVRVTDLASDETGSLRSNMRITRVVP